MTVKCENTCTCIVKEKGEKRKLNKELRLLCRVLK
jgi:hypothetical protein